MTLLCVQAPAQTGARDHPDGCAVRPEASGPVEHWNNLLAAAVRERASTLSKTGLRHETTAATVITAAVVKNHLLATTDQIAGSSCQGARRNLSIQCPQREGDKGKA